MLVTHPICDVRVEWGSRGVSSVSLLEPGEGEEPVGGGGRGESGSGARAELAGRVLRHLSGEPQGFSDVPLDLEGAGEFASRVYGELRGVPAGSTVTYGELARRVGVPGGARAVARAMATNRHPIFVPCHRVVGSGGGPGGFGGGRGLTTKLQLLRAEGVRLPLPRGAVLSGSLFDPYLWDIAVDSLCAWDRHFARLASEVGRVFLPRAFPGNPFAALVEAVCCQQLAGGAAEAIFRKLEAVLGGEPVPGAVLAAGEPGLRSAGLSGGKAATVLELARRVESGELSPGGLSLLPVPELFGLLTQVKGIGPWTVQMFAIFHLGLPDVFPPGDLGIRKAVTRLAGTGDLRGPAETDSIGSRWAPLRTVATYYLWRSLEAARPQSRAASPIPPAAPWVLP